MSDQPPEQPPEQQPEPEGSESARLDRVESKLDRLADAVNALLPRNHADAQQREEQRLDRGSDVQSAVAAELERRDKAAADAKAAEDKQNEERSLRERLAALEEHKPAPPVRRATLALGWGDPRDER